MHNKRKAFTLAEVLVAIVIAGIVLTSLFSFLAVFQSQLRKNISANDQPQVKEEFAALLRQEIPKAHAIELKKTQQNLVLEYEISNIKPRLTQEVIGRQVNWFFNNKNHKIMRQEINYKTSLTDYLKNNSKITKTQLPAIYREFSYPSKNDIDLRLIYNDENRKKPILLLLKTYLTKNKKKISHSEFIKLAI